MLNIRFSGFLARTPWSYYTQGSAAYVAAVQKAKDDQESMVMAASNNTFSLER
jgi:hypothetical protein